MKRFGIFCLTTSLLLQACAGGGQHALQNVDDDDVVVFGKIHVINEKGQDISQNCKLLRTHIDENNLVIQQIDTDDTNLRLIQCKIGHSQYRIDARNLTFNNKPDTANYFGDITFTLSPTHTYNVSVKDNMESTAKELQNNPLPTHKNLAKASGEKRWGKYDLGDYHY